MTEQLFHPDDIDEQIDRLSSSTQHRAVSTDERLLHDMQLLLNAGDINEQQQEDRDSVKRVWTTITAKGIHTQTTHNNRRTTERFTIMSTPSSMPKRPTSWGRRLGLLSVAAIVIVLLGSALVVFTSSQREGQVTHQPNTSTGAAPTATPTPPPVGKQGTTVYTYQQQGYGIYGLQWSPDGKRIVSTNSGVYSWDAFNGAKVIKYASLTINRSALTKNLKTPSLLFAQLSPDGTQLAVWNTTRIELYDVITGKKLKTFTYTFSSDQQTRDQFSPYVGWSTDSKSLKAIAQLTEKGEVIPSISKLVTYDVASGEKKQEVTLNVKGVLDRVRWSPDGKYVAAGLGSEGSVYVFDSETGKTVSKRFGSGPIETIELSWSPDSKQIAARFDDGIYVWDAINAKGTVIYQGGWNPVWSPNGKYIAVVDGATTSVVRILDAATGKTLYTYKEHKGAVYDLAWSPDSVYIASGEGGVNARGGGTGDTGTVRVWVARP
jgi:WD40 repeat protein